MKFVSRGRERVRWGQGNDGEILAWKDIAEIKPVRH